LSERVVCIFVSSTNYILQTFETVCYISVQVTPMHPAVNKTCNSSSFHCLRTL